ncbi:MAG: PHP domain-containing protein [bacterium]|nr:PHP domain-containing protein [bacterium]
MGLFIDLHVHTSRYSTCSRLDPCRLIDHAVKAGLSGVVITEHHRQWKGRELAELVEESKHTGFVLLSGFEYASSQGDLLVYGLDDAAVAAFEPGWAPEKAAEHVIAAGGVCVAAHPTRHGLGFDERLFSLPVAAVEACSVNMQPHEQQLAWKLSEGAGIPAVAASDAHRLADVGRWGTEFLDDIRDMAGLQDALSHGRFRSTAQEWPARC